jgi:bifunctional ADP-heptose synthase (sugar kinase/adenylyltransferase)
MLLTTDQLPQYRQQLAMVDGSFDPIHDGHIGYFKAASELGVPLLCNVAPDSWTVTKHPVFLEQEQRGIVLDAIRHISFVHLADIATVEVLRLLQPKFYIKGNDWVARGGVPEAEAAVCAEFGIEVVYLATVTNSSSRILKEWANQSEKNVR